MKFHAQRRMFACVDGEVLIGDVGDIRSHGEWLGLSYPLIRGYADSTGFYFYSTEDCQAREGDWHVIRERLSLLVAGLELAGNCEIWEGTIKGEVGERWKGKKYRGTIGVYDGSASDAESKSLHRR